MFSSSALGGDRRIMAGCLRCCAPRLIEFGQGIAMATMNRSHAPTTETDPGAGKSGRVSFRFHARALAALGRDLVTDDVVAVMELVKNSYDALAAHAEARIRPSENSSQEPYIEIVDDGHGMDYETIQNAWCVIATPFKQEQPVLKLDGRSRPVTGEKGLGRLSAARLGSEIDVVTKTVGGPVLGFSLNWDELLDSEDLGEAAFNVSSLPAATFDGDHGTRIRIGALRSVWDEKKIENLREHLTRLVSPFAKIEDFSLRLDAPGGPKQSSIRDIRPPEFMSRPKYAIEGDVDPGGSIRAQYRFRPIDGSAGRDREIREDWVVDRDTAGQFVLPGLNGSGPGCGPFQFEFRAWDLTKDDTRDIEAHFRESRRNVRGAISSQRGVSVYRDDILALPKSDGTRDLARAGSKEGQ